MTACDCLSRPTIELVSCVVTASRAQVFVESLYVKW